MLGISMDMFGWLRRFRDRKIQRRTIIERLETLKAREAAIIQEIGDLKNSAENFHGLSNTYDHASQRDQRAFTEALHSFSRTKVLPVDGSHFEKVLRTHSQGFWSATFKGSPKSYPEVIRRLARKNKVKTEARPLIEVEKDLIIKVYNRVWEKLDESQREEMIRKAREEANSRGTKHTPELVGAALLGSAQLSGFGVYLAASTLLGGVSSAMGITLPFAAYTATSSAISVIIGPLGWLTIGAFFIGRFLGPDQRKMANTYIMLAAYRTIEAAKLIGALQNVEDELAKVRREIAQLNKDFAETKKFATLMGDVPILVKTLRGFQFGG